MTTAMIQLLVQVIELAARVVPDIVEAIRTNGELSEDAKSDLVLRVERARIRVREYEPKDV